MENIKQQLIADIKVTEGIIKKNSYYYNLLNCNTQKQKDVVRNAVNRLRDKLKENNELYSYMLYLEKQHQEENRMLMIKLIIVSLVVISVICFYLFI